MSNPSTIEETCEHSWKESPAGRRFAEFCSNCGSQRDRAPRDLKFERPTPDVLRLGPPALFQLEYDGHVLPYVTAEDVTDKWAGWANDPPDDVTYDAERIARAVRGGERVFNLTLDGRFGYTCVEGDLFGLTFFLANAMAVAAGYTSHGANSRRINRHGVSRV